MELSNAVTSLSALAQASRLSAFKALVEAGPAGLQPSALAARLGVPANTLSFHLKTLMTAGLVSQERAGRTLVYRANYEQANALIGFLTVNCCGGHPCGLSATTNPTDQPLQECPAA